MGYYTEFILLYKNKTYYTCDRDGFEKYVDINIKRLAESFALYREYIVDILKFLNIDRSDDNAPWPKWSLNESNSYTGDNMYFMDLTEDGLVVFYRGCPTPQVVNLYRLKRTSEFTNFLNHRFILNKIWQKYNITPDLAKWIQTTYF